MLIFYIETKSPLPSCDNFKVKLRNLSDPSKTIMPGIIGITCFSDLGVLSEQRKTLMFLDLRHFNPIKTDEFININRSHKGLN